MHRIRDLAPGLVLLVVLGAPLALRAQAGSLFADPRAERIGDVLTVVIQESASATNRSATNSEKSNEVDIGSTVQQTGGNILGFIPLHSLQSNVSNGYEGQASTSRSAQLSARMTVTVVDKKTNGDLVVEGVRKLKINGETEAIYLNGEVSPALISRGNTILSSNIGNLHIEYTGKGTITQGSRPGIFVRLINWIF